MESFSGKEQTVGDNGDKTVSGLVFVFKTEIKQNEDKNINGTFYFVFFKVKHI